MCALVTGAHNFLRRMESLHRNKGGASSKRAEPSEKEGMGLAVGAAMLWCKLRDSTSGAFFTKIAKGVKRCMDGDRTFSKEDMVHFVQNKLFGGIPQYAVERWIQHEYLGKEGDALVALQKDTVQNFMYRSVDSGAEYAEALKLCRRACMDEILPGSYSARRLAGGLSGGSRIFSPRTSGWSWVAKLGSRTAPRPS